MGRAADHAYRLIVVPGIAPVDHAAIARACGCDAVRILDASKLQEALTRAVASGRPNLIEVMTDPQAHPPLSLFANMVDSESTV